MAEEYDLDELPALGHFDMGALTLYFGDLRRRDRVADWVDETARRSKDSKTKKDNNKKTAAKKSRSKA